MVHGLDSPLKFTVVFFVVHREETDLNMILSQRVTAILFVVLAATTTTLPQPANSLSYSQYKTLISLFHSLLTRVANLRSSRGDVDGSHRARLIAEKLERWQGVGFWGAAWSVGWDYVWNYAWSRDLEYGEIYGVVSDLNQLGKLMSELTRSNSGMDRASWMARNYGNALTITKRMLNRLLKVFKKSGVIREIMETMRREVTDGGLLRDCLELGSNDLKGIIQNFKEIASQFYSSSDYSQEL